jgi:crossover junction endodeoxyribonuclease RuvC
MIAILERFKPVDVAHVGLELVTSRPDQGVASMFSFGVGFGYWEMGIKFAKFRYTRIPPQKWQRAMLEGVSPENDGSILRAKQLFPHVSFEGKRGGSRDGRADSLLIAEFVRRQVMQGLL